MIEKLKMIEKTLELITVNGRENIEMLFSCMLTIENIIQQLEGKNEHTDTE